MRNHTLGRSLAAYSAGLSLAIAAAPSGAVVVGQMEATASENFGVITTNNGATSVTAPVLAVRVGTTGSANASASATEWKARASGGTAPNHFDGVATSYSSFTLWNTTLNQALTPAELAGVSLSFNFALSGTAGYVPAAPGPAVAATSVTTNTEILLGSFQNVAKGGTLALDSSGWLHTGNLMASGLPVNESVLYAINFANVSALSGTLFGTLQVSDGALESSWNLKLASVQQTGSSTTPMALRFADDSLVAISAVPEPQTWALLSLGLLVVGLKRRRA